MTPYHLLAEAAKRNENRSFLDAWHDFACWEKARGYRDDPNAASKDDIDWVQTLHELATRLEDRQGNSDDCRNALEAAAASFAGLEHEQQMYDALVTWHQQRQRERAEAADKTTRQAEFPDNPASIVFPVPASGCHQHRTTFRHHKPGGSLP